MTSFKEHFCLLLITISVGVACKTSERCMSSWTVTSLFPFHLWVDWHLRVLRLEVQRPLCNPSGRCYLCTVLDCASCTVRAVLSVLNCTVRSELYFTVLYCACVHTMWAHTDSESSIQPGIQRSTMLRNKVRGKVFINGESWELLYVLFQSDLR